RPEILDAAVEHQRRRHVAADRHERAVPERDLARVAGEHVEPEQRDRVDRDVRDLRGVEVRDQVREPEHDQARDDERPDLRRQTLRPAHTRLTASRPNSPAGRTRSTPRMIASATASWSSEPTKLTYVPTRFST